MRTASCFKFSALAVVMILMLSIGGCATVSTLGLPLHERKPLVMSGTRLNMAALRKDTRIADRFGVSAPDYPLLDIPFSATLDVLSLGYTVPVALFNWH